ncbi:hypothetical protein [Sphingomonas adhaesiva]|uniref:hypothetical protein n=1 Tax=Sphingomonas adhaesiva TaxID=28212 RepID=UPI002FFCF220
MSTSAPGPFRTMTVAILIAVGVVGFVAMLVLGAFAPDLRSGRNGGGHALSDAATGYSALVELARATGRHPRIVRDPRLFNTPDLLVATPERGEVNISAALTNRDYVPTLFVLPKWRTEADPDRTGWVRRTGMLPLSEPIGVLAPGIRFAMARRRDDGGEVLATTAFPETVRLRAPWRMQVITGATFAPPDEDADEEAHEDGEEQAARPVLRPLVVDRHGAIVLAQIGTTPRYVLSDPDLIDNLGVKELDRAAAALAMLDALDPRRAKGIAFDVSFNGLGPTQNPLKLMFEPPFLAMTLTLAVALSLVGWRALARFGPIVPRRDPIPAGKTALVDNSAALVRKAGREAAMGARYAAAIRDRVARAFGVPGRVQGVALTAYLDTIGDAPHYSQLAGAVEAAGDRHAVLRAARALHAWSTSRIGRDR